MSKTIRRDASTHNGEYRQAVKASRQKRDARQSTRAISDAELADTAYLFLALSREAK